MFHLITATMLFSSTYRTLWLCNEHILSSWAHCWFVFTLSRVELMLNREWSKLANQKRKKENMQYERSITISWPLLFLFCPFHFLQYLPPSPLIFSAHLLHISGPPSLHFSSLPLTCPHRSLSALLSVFCRLTRSQIAYPSALYLLISAF